MILKERGNLEINEKDIAVTFSSTNSRFYTLYLVC